MHWTCLETSRVTQVVSWARKCLSLMAAGLLISATNASANQPVGAVAEIEAFGETVLLQTPFQSFAKRSSANSNHMLSRTQLTPEPGDPLYGRHSLEILSIKGGAQQGLSPSVIATELNSQSHAFCRQTPKALILPDDVDGAALFSSCPAQSHLGGDLAMVQAVFFGPRDVYFVIWTDLVRPPENIVLDSPIWQQRIASMLPQYFCAPAKDNPQMSDCLSPKRVKAIRRQPAATSSR